MGRTQWIIARSSLVRRFFIVFLLAIAAPVLVMGVAVLIEYRRFTLELAVSRAGQAVSTLAQGIDEEIKHTALLTATLSTDQGFVRNAVQLDQTRGRNGEYEASARVEERLSAFFNYTNKIGAVLLYFRDRPVLLHRNNALLFERPLERGEWFRAVTEKPDATVVLGDLDSYSLHPGTRPLLKVAVCPSSGSLAKGFEAMIVAFRMPFLDRIAESAQRGTEELLLVDGEGRVILSPGSRRTGERIDASMPGPSTFSRGRSTYIASSAAIPSTNWTLVSVTDYSALIADVDAFARLARLVLAALLLAFAVYIEVFFRRVIQPVHAVIREMGRVERGDWEVHVPESGPAEISQLGKRFNAMVGEVKRLTRERELQERERARLELEALRLQINPHFLTNTLNSIRMMAAISNAEPIRRMTSALMRIVSSSFRDGDSLAALGVELDLLEQYLLIMRVRYGDTFDVLIDVPQDLRGLRVLRMLLQPLVENAILHGLQGLDRRGEIRIKGWMEPPDGGARLLLLEVNDNGQGVDSERLIRALAEAPRGHHGMTSIGLANLRRRIVLNHGDGYGLDVQSGAGRGTRALLRLPVIRADSA